MIRAVTIFAISMLGLSITAVAEEMTDPVTGMDFVRVADGCFTIGSETTNTTAPVQIVNSSKPKPAQQKVISGGAVREHATLDDALLEVVELSALPVSTEPVADDGRICLKGFWMGKFEVTQGQYQKVMGDNPAKFNKGDNHPVERVRWFDARQFVRKLNEKTGKQFRLPSEAEWEYAAHAGDASTTYGAAGKAKDVAWYMKTSGDSTHPVGTKKANAFGLYDLSGNVWEWTADCWNESRIAMPKDGSAQTVGKCTARVLKGGSWYDADEYIRVSARLWNDTDRLDNNSGFRLVHD